VTSSHPSTWLLEFVDGPVAGAMCTIPWPHNAQLPPTVRTVADPAGGPDLMYLLRDTDLIHGIAWYTSLHVINEVFSHPSGSEVRYAPSP